MPQPPRLPTLDYGPADNAIAALTELGMGQVGQANTLGYIMPPGQNAEDFRYNVALLENESRDVKRRIEVVLQLKAALDEELGNDAAEKRRWMLVRRDALRNRSMHDVLVGGEYSELALVVEFVRNLRRR